MSELLKVYLVVNKRVIKITHNEQNGHNYKYYCFIEFRVFVN